jgi:hypothetical protein
MSAPCLVAGEITEFLSKWQILPLFFSVLNNTYKASQKKIAPAGKA